MPLTPTLRSTKPPAGESSTREGKRKRRQKRKRLRLHPSPMPLVFSVRVCVVLSRAAAYEVHIDKEVHTPAWANLKFDKAFTLRETSCAHKYLMDFWATTGTFITALCSAGLFRSLIDLMTRKLFHMVRALSLACTHAYTNVQHSSTSIRVCALMYAYAHTQAFIRSCTVSAYSFANS